MLADIYHDRRKNLIDDKIVSPSRQLQAETNEYAIRKVAVDLPYKFCPGYFANCIFPQHWKL